MRMMFLNGRWPGPLAWAAVLTLGAGCNQYEMFRVTGYEQLSFSNKADILFVIDNSDTMRSQAESMAVNFSQFVGDLDPGQRDVTFDGLDDAVDNYIGYVQDRGQFLDFRFTLTTSDVDANSGERLGPTLKRGDAGVTFNFLEQLACEGICFNGAVQTDPGYSCGDIPEKISTEYLTCACGGGGWNTTCGSAVEEQLESVFLAMCRAVENPPTACFEDIVIPNPDNPDYPTIVPSLLSDRDRGTNDGMLRDGVTFFPVIVSDEGDNSRRLFEQERIPLKYEQLFAQFDTRMTWVTIGQRPNQSQNDARCPGTAQIWGIDRFDYLVQTTSGKAIDIFDTSCDPRDFAEALGELAELLNNLVASFALQAVPVPGSIVVIVDGKKVDESEQTGVDARFGLPEFSDGWSYRSSDNSVVFHGEAIPSNDSNVEVYYQPMSGMPRELPF